MSSAFVRESGGVPQIYETRDSAERAAGIHASIDGDRYVYEVRSRSRGGYMVARLEKDGTFESWVEE